MIKGETTTCGGGELAHRAPCTEELDETSKAIIEALQQDGRRPFEDIALEVGLDAEQVAAHVRRMVDCGAIQITAVTDPLQLGFARQAMLGITVEGCTAASVARELARVPELVYVVRTAGGFDLMVEVVGESDAHLVEVVATKVKPVTGVSAVQTFLYVGLEKQTYAWGVR